MTQEIVTPPGRWCNKLNSEGDMVLSWEPPVRIDPQLFETIVYLYPDSPTAEARDGFGGTGFMVNVATAYGVAAYVVTNRHVIEDGFCTISINTRDGGTSLVETDERAWRYPKDDNWDLAIHPLNCLPNFKLLAVPTHLCLSNTDLETMDIRIGDDLALIGRFISMEGVQTNMPTARFGHLVQMPGDHIKDERGRAQACFLAQIHSLPGFSGSPVFLMQDLVEKDMERGAIGLGGTGRLIRLLGVNCGHVDALAPVYSSGAPMRELLAAANTGIARVLPAWVIVETINADVARHSTANLTTRVTFHKP